jgi:hypothetical protein
MTALLIGLAVVALVVIIVLASQGSGPRVTRIDRTIRHEKEDDE